jgi:flavin-dependent dehydrogenase
MAKCSVCLISTLQDRAASVILQHLRISSFNVSPGARSRAGRRFVCSDSVAQEGKSLEPKHYSRREVAIIGGSAAGMFTAHLLARQGARVQVFEGAGQLDPRPRTLIVTAQMLETVGPASQQAITNEIRRFELFTDGRVAEIALHRPDLVVERSKLIRGLASQAEAAGAQILLGRRFLGMQTDARQLELTLERNQDGRTEVVGAQTVVGADGAVSRVAQAAGWPKQSTVPLLQAIVRLPRGMRVDTTRVWFIPEDTPYFYWLIPQSPVQGALGLIGENGVQTRRVLDRFLEKHHLEPLEFQAARIPLYTGWIPVRRRLPSGEIYLVGDAAGHVKVTTVGGIVTGFRGALGVAEAILNRGAYRRLKALKRELDIHLLIRKAIHNFKQADYSRLVDLINATVRQDLETCTRDEPAKMLLRLCLHEPRLLLMGLRSLLANRSALRVRDV